MNAQEKGFSFWKGVGTTTSDIATPTSIPLSDSQYGNNAELRADYDTNIGSKDGMTLAAVEEKVNTSVFLGNENNLAPGYKMDSSGNITNKLNQNVPGYTQGIKKTWYGKLSSQTTIAPATKGYSMAIKNMIFKHEFMHAWHWSSGFRDFYAYSERATSMFSEVYSNAFGFSYSPQNTGYYPAQYSWTNFKKIVPLWIE